MHADFENRSQGFLTFLAYAKQDLRKLREVRPIGGRKSYPKSIFKDYYMVQHYIEERV